MTADAFVIGGGPAGCAFAIEAARVGLRVALAERGSFPRAKVCGEFVSPAATGDLEALLSPKELQRCGAPRVDLLTLEAGERSMTWSMPKPAWVLSRATLDAELLQRAREAGVDVREKCGVAAVEHDADAVLVRLRGGEDVRAKCVVHADGSGRLDAAGPTKVDRHVLGLKCHMRIAGGVQGLAMRAAGGAYAGLVGIEGGLATCALVARTLLVRKFGNDHDALLAAIWPRLADAERVGNWMTSPVPRAMYRRASWLRSFRIGNAGAALDPVGGEGIGNALFAGKTLAASLMEHGVQETGLQRAQAELAEAYRKRFRLRMAACRAAACTLMRPGLAVPLVAALSLPGLASVGVWPWYALTGKG
ncbi:MAG: lycopene cyclase family protein [Planctomycetota bacterium]